MLGWNNPLPIEQNARSIAWLWCKIGLAGHVLAQRPGSDQHIYDYWTPGSWNLPQTEGCRWSMLVSSPRMLVRCLVSLLVLSSLLPFYIKYLSLFAPKTIMHPTKVLKLLLQLWPVGFHFSVPIREEILPPFAPPKENSTKTHSHPNVMPNYK